MPNLRGQTGDRQDKPKHRALRPVQKNIYIPKSPFPGDRRRKTLPGACAGQDGIHPHRKEITKKNGLGALRLEKRHSPCILQQKRERGWVSGYMKKTSLNEQELHQVDQEFRQPGTILIDLRDEEDYRNGHIPGAKNIPYEQWEIEKETWKHRYGTVVFYCERGNQSMYAAKEMNKRGYYAISIAGGYQGYKVWKGIAVVDET